MIQKNSQNIQLLQIIFTIILIIITQQEKEKFLIVFDDMIADTMTNKKFQAIIKKLFIRGRK